jgi:hypothetical protein
VVDDLAAATAFFVELGLELQGEGQVDCGWVDGVVGSSSWRSRSAEAAGRPRPALGAYAVADTGGLGP